MDIYSLTDTFLAKDVIDQFVSSIWTERYTASGEFQIVVPLTARNLDLLAEGTYLGIRGSKEVMQVDTLNLKGGLLTATGSSLLSFLNQRYIWSYNPSDGTEQLIANYSSASKKPGEFISDLVTKFAISPAAFPTGWNNANLTWENESIPNLTLGDVDSSSVAQLLQASVGPLAEAIESVASQYGVGVSLYLDSADPVDGYSLKFKTYRGLDRTSGQIINPMVRLTLEMDEISDTEEVRSIAAYKNVVYVYYKNRITKHLADPEADEPLGMARRVLIVDNFGDQQPKATGRNKVDLRFVEGTPVWSGWQPGLYKPQYVINYYVTSDDELAFRNQMAKDALANHNYIRAIDGQASPMSDYKYGTDYGLGDVIELRGVSGVVSRARVTEFIRSQDESGDRSYPTIAVIG